MKVTDDLLRECADKAAQIRFDAIPEDPWPMSLRFRLRMWWMRKVYFRIRKSKRKKHSKKNWSV